MIYESKNVYIIAMSESFGIKEITGDFTYAFHSQNASWVF